MISINNVSKGFAGEPLFSKINFNIQNGQRIGLVGRNGSGKSTLFSLILGKESPDEGDIAIPKGYKIGSLAQHIHFTQDTVLKECIQVLDKEFEFEFFRAEKILSGLGFSEDDFHRNPNDFSGGFQIRINLCKCLLTTPNLLLLDEPTNYLDIVSLRWLKKFLSNFDGEVIIITHDRDFMDSVATHTMGIYRKNLKLIKGNTSKFYESLKLEEEIYEKTRINQQKKIDHLSSFVDKFGAKASKATQAQSKLKQLEKIEVLDKLENESSMNLGFRYQDCPGKTLMQVRDLAFSYTASEEDTLFSKLNFSIGKNERVGIIGKNGKGKSTLLNVLAGELKNFKGDIQSHPSIKIGHLGQTNINRLNANNTIIEEISEQNADLPMTAVRNICGSLLFTGDLAEKKISVLSGGEKTRVLLGKILANPTNLLLLDEPTNHLDMESIEVLNQQLQNYQGAVVVVSHSESMLRNLVEKLVVFENKSAQYFLGGYDEFLEKIGWPDDEVKNQNNSRPTLTKKQIHAKRQEIIRERSKVCSPLTSQIQKSESLIIEHEATLTNLQQDLENASKSEDTKRVLEISLKIGEVESQIHTLFEKMETLEKELLIHNEHFDKLISEL